MSKLRDVFSSSFFTSYRVTSCVRIGSDYGLVLSSRHALYDYSIWSNLHCVKLPKETIEKILIEDGIDENMAARAARAISIDEESATPSSRNIARNHCEKF